MKPGTDPQEVRAREWLLIACISALICVVYWWKLLNGGGLNGGDTYPYFMPQKMVFAQAIANGSLPLWHDLTGLGYPLHAESQAGVFYPTNQLLYRLFDFHTAYNVSIVLHYWLAFVFTWRFARCQKLGNAGAVLAAVVFVYGWFPARISLEWSIIGGVWLPLTLWLTDRLLSKPSLRHWALLTLCLAVHLLAGHFALAFINQLAILAYALLRRPSLLNVAVQTGGEPETKEASTSPPSSPVERLQKVARNRFKPVAWVSLSIVAALLTAAVQLLPTYELKRNSQRQATDQVDRETQEFNPAYGHMPPVYASQLLASWWFWHSPEIRDSNMLQSVASTARFGSVSAATNTVEAHLYWGLVPLLLILLMAARRELRRRAVNFVSLWTVIGIFGLTYATGWPLLVTRHLPGFSYFMGPGRYTILTALSGGLLSGYVWHQLSQQWKPITAGFVSVFIISITLLDLSWSSGNIAHAVVVESAPVERLSKSWLRQYFESRPNARLLAPGPNVCNLLKVSCVPQYLGIGPAIYYSSNLHPEERLEYDETYPTDSEAEQLRDLGVTHILTLDALQQPTRHLQLLSQFPDSFLNTVWPRGGQPIFLYELVDMPNRMAVDPPGALRSVELTSAGPTERSINVTLSESATVVLKELMYPGWQVLVDGMPTTAASNNLSMRAVDVPAGRHNIRWVFQSNSFRIGAAISLVCLLLLQVVIWRPALSRRQGTVAVSAGTTGTA